METVIWPNASQSDMLMGFLHLHMLNFSSLGIVFLK